MSSMEPSAFTLDVSEQQTMLSMTGVRSVDDGSADSRTVPSSAEIEIPLELVGCDERLTRRLDDARPRPRRKLTVPSTAEGQLSPLHDFIIQDN